VEQLAWQIAGDAQNKHLRAREGRLPLDCGGPDHPFSTASGHSPLKPPSASKTPKSR